MDVLPKPDSQYGDGDADFPEFFFPFQWREAGGGNGCVPQFLLVASHLCDREREGSGVDSGAN